MAAAVSEKRFVEALDDYQDAVREGMEKLRKRAGSAAPSPNQDGVGSKPEVVNWSDL
jgi:hypothetical protein